MSSRSTGSPESLCPCKVQAAMRAAKQLRPATPSGNGRSIGFPPASSPPNRGAANCGQAAYSAGSCDWRFHGQVKGRVDVSGGLRNLPGCWLTESDAATPLPETSPRRKQESAIAFEEIGVLTTVQAGGRKVVKNLPARLGKVLIPSSRWLGKWQPKLI